MAFGIHALNISPIIALLHFVHGAAGGACTDHAAGHQTATGPDSGAAPAADCSAGCRAQCGAGRSAGNPATHSRLIGCRAANLEKGVLPADNIIITKLIERHAGTRQYHNTGPVGHAGATGYSHYNQGRNTLKKRDISGFLNGERKGRAVSAQLVANRLDSP